MRPLSFGWTGRFLASVSGSSAASSQYKIWSTWPSIVPSSVQLASNRQRAYKSPLGEPTTKLWNTGATAFPSALPPASSGKDNIASMDSSRLERLSTGCPGRTWKSERLIVLELCVGPKRRLNAERSAVLPEPLAPIKAVMSWSRSTVTGQSPKHRKLRSVIDLIFKLYLRRTFGSAEVCKGIRAVGARTLVGLEHTSWRGASGCRAE